ncbi:hypothetical protein HK099_000743 [Clydaea vesicula]|uniref:Ion transport domain-containing protein n=1 Tax=Clydaea vesicula TaxID=447962 RepID=A0AAD5U5F5_9FUNG|nr:hypothetical protein HK099_000743 [Clydaea vesicula]
MSEQTTVPEHISSTLPKSIALCSDSGTEKREDTTMTTYDTLLLNMPPWKVNIFNTLNKKHNKAGRIIHYVISFTILLSIVLLMILTIPTLTTIPYPHKLAIYILNSWCILVFTIEFILNCLCQPNLRFNLYWNILDILSLSPFYVELFVALYYDREQPVTYLTNISDLNPIVVFRFFRILRLFKIFKRSEKLRLITKSMLDAMEGLILLVTTFAILVVFFATLQFYAERTGSYFDFEKHVWLYPDGELTPYQSVPAILFDTTMISISYSKVVKEQEEEKVLKREKRLLKKRNKNIAKRLENEKNTLNEKKNEKSEFGEKVSYDVYPMENFEVINIVDQSAENEEKKKSDDLEDSLNFSAKKKDDYILKNSVNKVLFDEFFKNFSGNLRDINLKIGVWEYKDCENNLNVESKGDKLELSLKVNNQETFKKFLKILADFD